MSTGMIRLKRIRKGNGIRNMANKSRWGTTRVSEGVEKPLGTKFLGASKNDDKVKEM